MGEGQAGRQHRGSESFQDYGIDAEGYATDTERNTFDPYEGHPALGGSDAGHGQQTDYETELNQ